MRAAERDQRDQRRGDDDDLGGAAEKPAHRTEFAAHLVLGNKADHRGRKADRGEGAERQHPRPRVSHDAVLGRPHPAREKDLDGEGEDGAAAPDGDDAERPARDLGDVGEPARAAQVGGRIHAEVSCPVAGLAADAGGAMLFPIG